MNPVVFFATPGTEHLAGSLECMGLLRGAAEFRKFPDGESYVRLMTDVAGRRVVLLGALNNPDPRLMTVLLTAAAARENGATEVGLAIPYLPYMRQDIAFQSGEPVSAVHFARTLSLFVDWVVTLDPHLHRFSSLDQVFGSTRTRVVSAVPAIAEWIQSEINNPLIIGPDSESAQWVLGIAQLTGAECLVLEKKRSGDRSVSINVPNAGKWSVCQPVIVDDIVSTGATMARLIEGLIAKGFKRPICCSVHALFSEGAEELILSAGALSIVSCESVVHPSNKITIGKVLAEGVREILCV